MIPRTPRWQTTDTETEMIFVWTRPVTGSISSSSIMMTRSHRRHQRPIGGDGAGGDTSLRAWTPRAGIRQNKQYQKVKLASSLFFSVYRQQVISQITIIPPHSLQMVHFVFLFTQQFYLSNLRPIEAYTQGRGWGGRGVCVWPPVDGRSLSVTLVSTELLSNLVTGKIRFFNNHDNLSAVKR